VTWVTHEPGSHMCDPGSRERTQREM
jgi:hypothetical protein